MSGSSRSKSGPPVKKNQPKNDDKGCTPPSSKQRKLEDLDSDVQGPTTSTANGCGGQGGVKKKPEMLYAEKFSLRGVVTRAESARRLEQAAAPIRSLPPEVLQQILSKLPFEDLKSARMVCKDWRLNCSHYFNFSNKTLPLSNTSYKALSKFPSGFRKLFVSELTNVSIMQNFKFPGIEGVQCLKFRNPNIEPTILTWLFRTFFNVKEIEVLWTGFTGYNRNQENPNPYYFSHFLSRLENSIEHCVNLEKLLFVAGRMDIATFSGPWYFSSECLLACKKLEYFYVRSCGSFKISLRRGPPPLPPTLIDFHRIILRQTFSSDFEGEEPLCPYCLQLCTRPLIQMRRILPNIQQMQIYPDHVYEEENWQTLLEIVPTILTRMNWNEVNEVIRVTYELKS